MGRQPDISTIVIERWRSTSYYSTGTVGGLCWIVNWRTRLDLRLLGIKPECAPGSVVGLSGLFRCLPGTEFCRGTDTRSDKHESHVDCLVLFDTKSDRTRREGATFIGLASSALTEQHGVKFMQYG